MALKPQEVRSVSDGSSNDSDVYIMSVEEQLEMYDINGLSLGDLQEKYIDMVDSYEEKISESEDKYNELYSSYSDLQDTVSELQETIDELKEEMPQTQPHNSFSGLFIVVLIIGIAIAYYCGKNNKERGEK